MQNHFLNFKSSHLKLPIIIYNINILLGFYYDYVGAIIITNKSRTKTTALRTNLLNAYTKRIEPFETLAQTIKARNKFGWKPKGDLPSWIKKYKEPPPHHPNKKSHKNLCFRSR